MDALQSYNTMIICVTVAGTTMVISNIIANSMASIRMAKDRLALDEEKLKMEQRACLLQERIIQVSIMLEKLYGKIQKEPLQ
jgi:hypothetical protein